MRAAQLRGGCRRREQLWTRMMRVWQGDATLGQHTRHGMLVSSRQPLQHHARSQKSPPTPAAARGAAACAHRSPNSACTPFTRVSPGVHDCRGPCSHRLESKDRDQWGGGGFWGPCRDAAHCRDGPAHIRMPAAGHTSYTATQGAGKREERDEERASSAAGRPSPLGRPALAAHSILRLTQVVAAHPAAQHG